MDEIDYKSEEIERATLESLHQCCPSDTRQEVGLDLVEVGDSIAALATNDPSILLNRTLGLGTRETVTAETVDAVAAAYASRGISQYFIHVYDDTLSDAARASLNGPRFVKRRGWMKFRSDAPSQREAKTDLRVEKIGVERSGDFGKIVCGAFGMRDISIPLLGGLANDERWHLFVSYDGDKPAGAGALFVDGGLGWLEWGATDPDFRRRGSQGSIMSARLKLAAELGCSHVFTETGEAVEGDPQHSYGNIMKYGFKESVLRQNFAPNPG
jgi:hypothetical protein